KKVSGLEPDIIGFGTPGTIDAESGLIKNSNSICYNGKPLQDDLGDQLGIPVILENDANCFALAETHFGIVREIDPGASVVFGIIMGTGVGGGIVVEGQVIKGKHGIGGEWGHNYLDGSGGKCYCGRTGCVETVLSGPALEKYYFRASGIEKKLPEIYRDYAKEKKYAVLTMDRLVHFFGKAVAVVINIIDPDVIVIGGGLGNMEILYTRGKEELRKYIFNHSVFCKIVRPKLGDSAGVFGAAALGMKV
ncbi:MAG: ROK family protein, partial [Cyclobacteriaceae bacterium]|nr:ROK family protein [Cyclobacteriaceae bacterium]